MDKIVFHSFATRGKKYLSTKNYLLVLNIVYLYQVYSFAYFYDIYLYLRDRGYFVMR